MTTSEPGDAPRSWQIENPTELIRWAFDVATTMEEGVAVLEFVRDKIGADPDFGDVIAAYTRGERVPNTDVEVIWTFNPNTHAFKIITPFAD